MPNAPEDASAFGVIPNKFQFSKLNGENFLPIEDPSLEEKTKIQLTTCHWSLKTHKSLLTTTNGQLTTVYEQQPSHSTLPKLSSARTWLRLE